MLQRYCIPDRQEVGHLKLEYMCIDRYRNPSKQQMYGAFTEGAVLSSLRYFYHGKNARRQHERARAPFTGVTWEDSWTLTFNSDARSNI